MLIYLDDILVAGKTPEEHCRTLAEVLLKAGLRLKKDKCTFMTTSVQYLGYQIDAHGIHPTEAKVRVIKEARTPKNVSESKAYLGILTYYGKFLPNLSTLLVPLYSLLQKNKAWSRTNVQEQAFQQSKKILTSSSVLVPLAYDASQYGLGEVLSHHFPNGEETPIAYASCTLSKPEQNYSQIEQEGLSLVFGVKKFHSYLYGRRFTMYTDHKPLQTLFNPNKSISTMVSQHIQRWALKLSMYTYRVKHRPGKAHCNADALSRLPLPDCPESTPVSFDIRKDRLYTNYSFPDSYLDMQRPIVVKGLPLCSVWLANKCSS